MQQDYALDPLEARIFVAVARSLTDREVADSLPDALLPVLARMPGGDRLQLRVLLRAIEFGPPLLTLTPRRFTRLSPGRQIRYLRRWMDSRVSVLRQGAMALRALAMLATYGDSRFWTAIGYGGPWLGRREVPVAARPRPERHLPLGGSLRPGITLGRDAAQDLVVRARVCVIGMGAGGASALAHLAARGVDVVGVEGGGAPEAGDFSQRELEMLPLLYREAGLRATADKSIGILQGKGVGGSTLHNTGLVYATPAGILDRWRDEHAFPHDDAVMGRALAEAMDALGATPITPDRINAANGTLLRGAERLGWRYRVALHNRLECSGCGYCMLGCAYDRKTNASLAYLPRATNSGARILADARVHRIEGRAGARRVRCQLLDGAGKPTGRTAIIEADRVIVAAGAIDSVALLRRSGLGNEHVGRHLRLHPSAAVSAVFPDRIEAWRGVPQSVLVEEFATFFASGRGGFLLVPAASNVPGLAAVVAGGVGPEHRAMMDRYENLAVASVLLHDEGEGTIRVTRDGRPRVHYWPSDADLGEMRAGTEALARLYLAAGADSVHLPWGGVPTVSCEADLAVAMSTFRAEPHRLPLNSVHPQGSCALGPSPACSAVDPTGQVWGEDGVYVADASIFPTSVGVPPQITIMALANLVADRVADRS